MKRTREATPQKRPSFVELYARREQGLNIEQEFGRRVKQPTEHLSPSEQSAFDALLKVYFPDE